MGATDTYLRTKRLIDICIATLALAVLAVPLLAVALLVRWRLGGPVLFRQERAGIHGRPFHLLKFRTMSDRRDAHGALAPDAERLSPFGMFLRAWSIDELPSLLNILRGDLSLVGPRPLFLRYSEFYTKDQARRLDVPPGLTGWAQVTGRNSLNWIEKFERDVWYVDHRSILLDFRIIALTVGRVLRRTGISAEGNVTMPEFRGADPAIQGHDLGSGTQ